MPEETKNSESLIPTGVQRDSETPMAKKPSVLFITSIILGVLTIILLAARSYYGVAR